MSASTTVIRENPLSNALKEQLENNVEIRDILGTVFIVPIDAPLPKDLESLASGGRTLLERLAVFDKEPESFALCLLTGQELFDIASCFRALTNAPKIALLEDLPGARYDALLIQGARRAGIRGVQWTTVAEFVEQRRRLEQRLGDAAQPHVAITSSTGEASFDALDDDIEEV